jgi:hypothetical protein
VPDDEQKQDDKFRPEAIAERVGQMAPETELDRIAQEEEQKLHARRKDKKGSGLEAAASRRLAKIGEGKVKRPSMLGEAAIPEADPMLQRAARAGDWVQKHRSTFGVFVAVAVLGVGGAAAWTARQQHREADASSLLAQAMADEHGSIVEKEDEDDDDSAAARRLYPTFRSGAARRDAALAQYKAVESKYAGTGAAMLARLAEGSLLLDANDAKGALAAYGDVKASPLGQADGAVRSRALEGVGFAHELSARLAPDTQDKELDAAMTAYKELEHVDVKGSKELGLYHQARVLEAKGDRAGAIEILKDLDKRVNEPGETHPFPYLGPLVEDRLRALDPTALPPKAPKPMGGPPGARPGPGAKPDNAQMQQLIRQLQEKAGKGGAAPAIPPPARPAPAAPPPTPAAP